MKTRSAPPVTIRPAQPTDLPAIAAVINANSLAELGTPRALLDDHGKLHLAGIAPPHAERVVAVDGSGQIVAFAGFVAEPPYVVHETGGAVHPDHWRRGIGSLLLAWAEERARQWLPHAPADARVVLATSAFEAETSARALLTAHGYVPVRAWVHLIADLDAPPPAPVWPAGITVRRMDQSRDWLAVGAELDAAFADHWGQLRPGVMPAVAEAEPEAEEEIEDEEDDPYWNSRDFCFVALDGDAVVASCLGNARAIEWPERGRVGSLSVLRPYRRRGIARALMLHAFGEFYRHGTRTIITDTDAAGFTGAYRLYQELGMRIYRTTHTFEKELRPGRELRVLTVEDLDLAGRA